MANLLLLNPFPAGFDSTQTSLTANGSIQLYGSSPATGEPINWNLMIDGIGYNEVNFRGNGVNGQNTAQTTGFAVSAGIATVTAANNFRTGWPVVFAGNTGTLSALFNNQPAVTILTATPTSFTFATAVTGTTTTGDLGIAYSDKRVQVPEPGDGATLLSTVTALSASGNVLTVAADNAYLPGAQAQVNVSNGTLGPKLANVNLTVLNSTSTAFTAQMPSAFTGTTGTGTASGINPPQPYSAKFWSAFNSGYTYSYNEALGTLSSTQQSSSLPVTSRLGVASNYTLLGASGITNTGSTTIAGGNIGSSPTTSITGFPPGTLTAPAVIDNVGASAAQTALSAAISYYQGLTPTLSGLSTLSTEGNGTTAATFTPGVYVGASALTMATGIILDALGNPNATFVFVAGSTINLASGQTIALTNGAQAANVVFVAGSSFTSVATSTVNGNILAVASITLGGGTLNGRALADNGSVTIAAAETVSVPSASSAYPVSVLNDVIKWEAKFCKG